MNRYLNFVHQNIKSFFKQEWYSVVLIILSLTCCYFFAGHILWTFDDIGRELYFPLLVLDKKVLYKDIFNLFGPFSYLFNTLIYKFFGSGMGVILFMGYVTSVFSILGIYKCASELLDKKTAFLVALFSCAIGITTALNFNYCIPYSYAILYGFIFFVWSLFYFIKFIKTDNINFMYLSVLFAGISVANKYEYFLYAFLLVSFIVWKNKRHILQKILSLLICMLPIIVCYAYLFYQGLDFKSFIKSFEMVRAIVFSEGYKYLYTKAGTYFSLTNIKIGALSFVKMFAFISLIFCSDKLFLKNKICGIFLYVLTISSFLFYMTKYSYNDIFAFFPILVFLMFVIKYKILNKQEIFTVLAAIFTGLKIFWCCYLKYYGVYFIPTYIIAFCLLIKQNKLIKKGFLVYLILLVFAILIQNIGQKQVSGYSVNTADKPIYTFIDTGWKINQTVKYIINNTQKTDKIVIYPEGQIINYLSKRPSESFYYALTPPYLEVFGEKNVVNYFKANPPEYFIFTNENMRTYNKLALCKDFGFMFCKFVGENYSQVHTIEYDSEDKEPYYIYKRI